MGGGGGGGVEGEVQCMYTHVRIYICTHMYVYTQCMCTHMYVYTHVCVHDNCHNS